MPGEAPTLDMVYIDSNIADGHRARSSCDVQPFVAAGGRRWTYVRSLLLKALVFEISVEE